MQIFDLHNDIATSPSAIDEFRSLKKFLSYEQKLIFNSFIDYYYSQFYPHTVVNAFWTSRLVAPLNYIRQYIKKYPKNSDRLYSIEDLAFVKNEETLNEICELPIVYASLTWNGENLLAGGVGSNAKLSDWGKVVAKKLVKKGIAIDTAHLNERSFFDLIELKDSMKIFNSHTLLKSCYNHERNLSDQQIKLLIARGGVVGLTPVNQFLKEKKATLCDFVAVIDTFVERFGIDNAAIGTDFFGADPLEGLENYDSFESLVAELEKLGYTRIDISKIFYRNASRFFQYKENKSSKKLKK